MFDLNKLKVGSVLRCISGHPSRIGEMFDMKDHHVLNYWTKKFRNKENYLSDYELVTVTPVPYTEPVSVTRRIVLWRAPDTIYTSVHLPDWVITKKDKEGEWPTGCKVALSSALVTLIEGVYD